MPGPFAILALAGAGAGAFGSFMGGRAKREVASYNANLLRQRATATEQASATQRELMIERGRDLKAAQRASYGKSGAVITSGTPLMVMAEQAGDIQRDILEQQRTGLIQAQQLRSAADMAHYQGRMATRAGNLGALTTLLGGVAGVGLAGGFSGGAEGGTT